MNSSNNPLKFFFFIALTAGIGIGLTALFVKGAQGYASVVKNVASVQEAILPAPEDLIINDPTTPVTEPVIELPKEVTLDFVGDIMLDRAVKKNVEEKFNGDYSALFKNVTEISKADIAFANLEGPVSTGGKKSGSVYSFRFSPTSLEAVADAGFDVLNIANNHIGDWNSIAFADTLDNIASAGLKYTGGGWNKKESETPVVIEKNNIKIGYLGFTDVGPDWMEAGDSEPGILIASDPNFDQIIQNASNQVDVLIVSFHWGVEYKKHTDRQAQLAHLAIDSGAKIVVGHHPHVSQDTEEYNGGLIAYSLGNFIFDQKFSEETMQGLLLEATVTEDGLKSYSTKVIKLNESFIPQTPTE